MVQTEYLNGGTLIMPYSDAGFMLLQVETGVRYIESEDKTMVQGATSNTPTLLGD